MVQAEARQMVEQAAAEVVHHPLAGVDLDLRAVRRHELVRDLQQHAQDYEHDQQDEAVAAVDRRQPPCERFGHGMALEDVIDHCCERPRLQRAESDLRQQQHHQQRDTLPVWTQERQGPDDQSLLRLHGRRAHRRHQPPTLRADALGRGGTRLGAILGMISGTIRSLLESAT
jgi:hypothetical protein